MDLDVPVGLLYDPLDDRGPFGAPVDPPAWLGQAGQQVLRSSPIRPVVPTVVPDWLSGATVVAEGPYVDGFHLRWEYPDPANPFDQDVEVLLVTYWNDLAATGTVEERARPDDVRQQDGVTFFWDSVNDAEACDDPAIAPGDTQSVIRVEQASGLEVIYQVHLTPAAPCLDGVEVQDLVDMLVSLRPLKGWLRIPIDAYRERGPQGPSCEDMIEEHGKIVGPCDPL